MFASVQRGGSSSTSSSRLPIAFGSRPQTRLASCWFRIGCCFDGWPRPGTSMAMHCMFSRCTMQSLGIGSLDIYCSVPSPSILPASIWLSIPRAAPGRAAELRELCWREGGGNSAVQVRGKECGRILDTVPGPSASSPTAVLSGLLNYVDLAEE